MPPRGWASTVAEDERDRRPLITPRISDAVRAQSELHAQQEAVLSDMANLVGNLQSSAKQIGAELDTHSVMLREMGNNVEVVQSRMDLVEAKLGLLLQRSGKSHFCIIIGLVGIIIVLFLLIVYT